MKMGILAAAAGACLVSSAARAGELVGPGRFCGYAPIIDLAAGEKVTPLEGGVHAGSFRWDGKFGSIHVLGIGWASRPAGKLVRTASRTRPARFAERRIDDGYEIAIWNGAHAAAYFRSKRPFTRAQQRAIDRVLLYEEGQTPAGCNFRTTFSWE